MKGSFGVIPPDPIKRVGDFALRYCGNLSQVFEKSGKLKKNRALRPGRSSHCAAIEVT
jgi:hypothetical protein